MTRNGLSVKKFSKRIGDAESLVHKWPFAALAPTDEIPTDIGYGHRPTSGIAVGRVMFANERARSVTLEVHESAYRATADNRISLLFDDPELFRPWQHIVGTALAAEVSVVESESGFSTHFRPRRILAIEPPMTHPSHKDAVRLTPTTGYVHGVVSKMDITLDEHTPATLKLNTPDSDEPITLNYLIVPEASMPGGLRHDKLQLEKGDVVRAGVASASEAHPGVFIANGTLHYLGRIAA